MINVHLFKIPRHLWEIIIKLSSNQDGIRYVRNVGTWNLYLKIKLFFFCLGYSAHPVVTAWWDGGSPVCEVAWEASLQGQRLINVYTASEAVSVWLWHCCRKNGKAVFLLLASRPDLKDVTWELCSLWVKSSLVSNLLRFCTGWTILER